MRATWTVFRKELVDALRDRRTLLVVLLSSVAVGPLVLVLLSVLVADIEQRAESRTLLAQGIEHAPTLRNYLERHNLEVMPAPPDHARRLVDNQLAEAVLVIAPGFESALAQGRLPELALVYSSANQRAQGSVARLQALLRGFNQERATLQLALRGVSPELLEALRPELHDLASPATRAAQLAFMVPFFVLMAVLYGALGAALDTTAGERERGSLEPLLMNPATPWQLTLGKWGAVASVGMLIALLSCSSFLPGHWLLRSDTLAAMFRFGPGEVLAFLGLLLPLSGALAALLMAIAIRCRSFKEAQANATVVVLAVSLLPLVSVFSQGAEAAWHRWVPALAQTALMGRVLKGEALALADLAVPFIVCVGVAVAALVFVARSLRAAAMR